MNVAEVVVACLKQAAYRIDRPLEAAKVIADAYSVAASPPQGPVFVEAPEDVWSMPSDLGAMGFAFPAALGVKLAAPERDVYAVVGDGEFMTTVQDLETAVREKIPVKIIVINDNSYRVLYARQKAQKMGRVFGTLHTNPDFVKLAETFGVEAMAINRDEDIPKAVKFITEPGLKLLELRISPDDFPPMNIEAALRF